MTLSAEHFDFVRRLVQEHSAIVLEESKHYLVESRLGPVAREHGYASVADLVSALRTSRHGALHDVVVDSMTTNETSFFRDVHPFNALRQEIIPALVQRRRAERRLVFWSAASSSGQEPYSIALTIRDAFPELADWDVQILATDLSSEMLARAASGRYSQLEVNRGLPATMLTRYFHRDGAWWQLSDSIRSMVTFQPHNLAKPWPPMPRVDVLFLRNVLIYFDLPTKQAILRRVRTVLRPDGCLLLGSAETTFNLDAGFTRVPVGRSACYQLASTQEIAS